MNTRQKLQKQGYSKKMINSYIECQRIFNSTQDKTLKAAMVHKMQHMTIDERNRIAKLDYIGR